MASLLRDLEAIGYKVLSARYTNGTWGRLSFELLEAMRYYRFPEPLQFGAIPLLKAMRWLDTRVKTRDGDGLLVLCGK